MLWTFRILVALNGLLLLIAFFYQSSGEDPAGQGIRIGFAIMYAIAMAGILLAYRLFKTPWVRIPMLVLLTLPCLSIVYDIALSI